MGSVTVVDVKPFGTITEKDVLNKFMNAQKTRGKNPVTDVSIIYASMAWAAIHPPEYFNLPDMMIQATHIDKQSGFGGTGDYLIVFLWLETKKGHAYVPVVFAIDNPYSKDFVGMLLAGTPAAQNVQALSKDEIQICIHGNTLFAGWTVPIPLHPQPYILPPACLLVEGYGDVKTSAYGLLNSSGVKSELEQNYFDAFVTFFHPASEYSGPGTDGKFIRDFIMTVTPPSKSER